MHEFVFITFCLHYRGTPVCVVSNPRCTNSSRPIKCFYFTRGPCSFLQGGGGGSFVRALKFRDWKISETRSSSISPVLGDWRPLFTTVSYFIMSHYATDLHFVNAGIKVIRSTGILFRQYPCDVQLIAVSHSWCVCFFIWNYDNSSEKSVTLTFTRWPTEAAVVNILNEYTFVEIFSRLQIFLGIWR